MPIPLDYQTPKIPVKQGPLFWRIARASLCIPLGIGVPILCLLASATSTFPVDPDADRFTAIAHLLFSGRICWPLYPALLCPIIAMAVSCQGSPKAFSFWPTRQGIYAGVLTSLLLCWLYSYDLSTQHTTPDSKPIQDSIALTIGIISATGLLVAGLYYLEILTINRVSNPLWITLRIFHILICIAAVCPFGFLIVLFAPAFILFAFTWMAVACWQSAPSPAPLPAAQIAWTAYALLQIAGWSATIYNAVKAYNAAPIR